jgi:hypothetical protein
MAVDNLTEKDYLKSIWHNLHQAAQDAAKVTFALETNDVLDGRLNEILGAINLLNRVVQNMPPPVVNLPAPIINIPPFPELSPPTVVIDPPDLSAIVTAVTNLKPGADPTDIADAIMRRLTPGDEPPEVNNALDNVVKALEKLDFRLRGVGSQAYGGGAVSFSDVGLTQFTTALSAAKQATLTPKGYQQLTSLSAASALTVPAGSSYAMLQAESQNVRYRDDGTNPTAGIGIRLVANTIQWYTGNLVALKFIEETASAKLNVSYYL